MTIDHEHKDIVFTSCHDKAELKHWHENLDNLYTKETLLKVLKKIAGKFSDYRMRFSNEPWPLNLNDIVKRGLQTKKSALAELLAKIFAVEENRRVWLLSLTDNEILIWKHTLCNLYISEKQVQRLTGIAPVTRERTSYYSASITISEGMCLFGYNTMGSWNETLLYFYLPSFIRKAFENLIDFKRVRPDAEVSPDAPELTFQAECETLTLVPIIKNLWMKGQLEMGRYKIAASAINRAAKLTKASEFVTAPDDKNARNLRASLLFNAFSIYGDLHGIPNVSKTIEPQDVIKNILTCLKSNTASLCGPLLSFIDKSTSKLYEGNTLWALWNNVSGYICSRPAGDWITIDELCDNLYNISDINRNLRVVSFRCIDDYMICNYRTRRMLNPANILDEVTVPAMLSIVALFASLGLLEIVYKTASDEASSPLSGLQRLKLTPLGEYVFGLSKTYTFTPLDKNNFFELSDDRLLIRALEDNNPYEGLLSQFATSIGSRRYIVTPQSFLAECYDKGDINSKIASFQQMICANPPIIWQDFFKSLLDHCKLFTHVSNKYDVWQVPPEATDLHELLVTDPEIRKCVLRAEGYNVLVPYEKMSRFKELLRKAGYLL